MLHTLFFKITNIKRKEPNTMKNVKIICAAIVMTLFFTLLGVDAILTAKENAFTACVHANRAATIEEIKIICEE